MWTFGDHLPVRSFHLVFSSWVLEIRAQHRKVHEVVAVCAWKVNTGTSYARTYPSKCIYEIAYTGLVHFARFYDLAPLTLRCSEGQTHWLSAKH